RSDQAKAKDATKLGEDGLPVHSFRTLLDDLATLAYNVCHTPLNLDARLVMTTRPTPVQEKAFRLLNVSPVACTQ
ncbi:IS1634 family transposase, partial [Caballeronia sp. 15715]